jgi:hypothetical protein
MQIFFEHYPSRVRQSATYLAHIIDHYDDLATRTSFAQTFLNLPYFSEQRLSSHFSPNFGFLSLNNYTLCNCDSCIATESLILFMDLNEFLNYILPFMNNFVQRKVCSLLLRDNLSLVENGFYKIQRKCYNMFWIFNIAYFVHDVVLLLIMI